MAESEPHYLPARALLDAAIAALEPGELIKSDRVGLLDLMSAIEVLDARTDSYTAAQESAQTAEKLPAFDATLNLLPEELLWILDELFRLEMTHLDGHPLISALFTCQYLRPAALSRLRTTSDVCSEGRRPPELRALVLRSMLLGTIKTTELCWEELYKGHIYEHEDVHLAMAGQSFPNLLASCLPRPSPSPLLVNPAANQKEDRAVSVDDVLETLDAAVSWVSANVVDEAVKERLIWHLAVRMDMVITTALLTNPEHATPEQVLSHLDRILAFLPSLIQSSTASSASGFEPSATLRGIFAGGAVNLLPSVQPIREIEAVPLIAGWERLRQWANEVSSVVKLWHSWNSGAGWAALWNFSSSSVSQAMLPYSRSLFQSIVMANRNVFVTATPVHLSAVFLHQTTGLPMAIWPILYATREGETSWDSPARRLLGWADRLSAVLVETVGLAGQNRARSRRRSVKSIGNLTNVMQEAEDLAIPLMTKVLQSSLDFLPPATSHSISHLKDAITTLLLARSLDAVLSGFELELYASNDWTAVWWVAQRLAERVEVLWGELQNAGTFAQLRRLEARVIASLAGASYLSVTLKPPAAAAPPTTPFLVDIKDSTAVQKARFDMRFRWLQSHPLLCEFADWDLFQAKKDELQSLKASIVAQDTLEMYDLALDTMGMYKSLAEAGDARQWMESASVSCSKSRDSLAQIVTGLDGRDFAAVTAWEGESPPAFPTRYFSFVG